jgi:glutamate synthase domain-containing protein 3
MLEYTSYLTYDDYKELGGTLSEHDFRFAERKAQRWLDYFTFDRCKELDVIPNEVREVLTEFIQRTVAYETQKEAGETITQYSNSVEQITFDIKSEDELKSDLQKIALEWLPDYLTNRLVNFDVRAYLQRKDNTLK